MVSKQNFGVTPEWIQWQLLCKRVASVEWLIESLDLGDWAIFDDPEDFRKFILSEVPYSVLERIVEYADFAITLDPPQCVDGLGIQKTSNLYGKTDSWWKITPDQNQTRQG